MAIQPHQTWAWVSQGTAADPRLGFVEMTAAAMALGVSQGRMQDPNAGFLALRHVDPAPWLPPEPPEELQPAAPKRNGNGRFVAATPAPAPAEDLPAAEDDPASSGTPA